MKGVGSLTVRLTFDPWRVSGAQLTIPLLGIDEHLTTVNHFERIPEGIYEGVLTTHLTSNKDLHRKLRFSVKAHQENIYTFNLSTVPEDIVLKPVDPNGNIVTDVELKVEGVDPAFRPVRDFAGLIHRLAPGEYQLKVLMPNLDILSFPLKVEDGRSEYTITVAARKGKMRREPRIPLAIPVALRTSQGEWIPSRSLNLSSFGLCCNVKGTPIRDRTIFVRLFVPSQRTPLEGDAKICWESRENEAASRIGLELMLPNPAHDLLGKWLLTRTQGITGSR